MCFFVCNGSNLLVFGGIFFSSKAVICCKAWHALVCCVDDSCLGNLLSQVVVMLLPCLEKCPNEVSADIGHKKIYFALRYFPKLYSVFDTVYRPLAFRVYGFCR